MTKTQNYQLPQWVKEDRIMMDDFNEAMRSIEKGMTRNRDALAEKGAELERKVNAAQAEAEKKPYAVGGYTGTGGEQFIETGFRPSFVIVAGRQNAGTGSASSNFVFLHGGTVTSKRMFLEDNGSRVVDVTENDFRFPQVNYSGERYDYIAFN